MNVADTKHGLITEETAHYIGLYAAFTGSLSVLLCEANASLFMRLAELALLRLELQGYDRHELKKALNVVIALSKSLDPEQEGTVQ